MIYIESDALSGARGESHVIRNAGGVVTDEIRSLAISQGVLGTKEIVLIHQLNEVV